MTEKRKPKPKTKRAAQAQRFMQPTQAQRRQQLALQAMGAAGPPIPPLVRETESLPAVNRAGERLRASSSGADHVFGGVADYLSNVGSSRFHPRNAWAAGFEVTPMGQAAALTNQATRLAYHRLPVIGKAGVEAAVNAVPNPFEEPRR
jgi:hypothetical protein